MTDYTASTISFVNATNQINDSADGLGFLSVGDFIEIIGSLEGDNDDFFRVVSVTAGTIVVTGTLSDESDGAEITIRELIEDEAIQAAIYLILPLAGLLNVKQVGMGDITTKNFSNEPNAQVFPGDFTQPQVAAQKSMREWSVQVELEVPQLKTDKETWAQFRRIRRQVVSQIENYPTLNVFVDLHSTFKGVNGVTRVRIGSDGDPAEIYDFDDGTREWQGPLGVAQTLRVSVSTRVAKTGGQYI